MSSNARHSKQSPEWYTPAPVVDLCRRALGGKPFDLDPASDPEANQYVQAARFFTKDDDGLLQLWDADTVFLNPPGGLVAEFWNKLIYEIAAGRTKRAIWIGYSLEQLQTLQRAANVFLTPLDFPTCYPSRRIAFVENTVQREARINRIAAENLERKARGERPKPLGGASPSHANYISFVTGKRADSFLFTATMRELGSVVVPAYTIPWYKDGAR